MADPISIATLAMIGSGVGGAVSAGGAIYGGVASSQMYKYQASVAEVNRKIALQNAEYSRAVGESQAEESGMKSRAQAGAIRAAQGASGFSLEGGSATGVRESQAMLGRYDQAVIRSNAAKAAYGHEVEALSYANEAELYRMAGKKSMTEGFIKAGSSILGGATSVADKWLQYGSMFGTT